jgi:hypothetical protein
MREVVARAPLFAVEEVVARLAEVPADRHLAERIRQHRAVDRQEARALVLDVVPLIVGEERQLRVLADVELDRRRNEEPLRLEEIDLRLAVAVERRDAPAGAYPSTLR